MQWIGIFSLLPSTLMCNSLYKSDLYVIGGWDGVGRMPVAGVDRLKISDGTVNTVSFLRQPRAWATVVVCEEYIIVFGGTDREQLLSSSETYHPNTDRHAANDTQNVFFIYHLSELRSYIDIETPLGRRNCQACQRQGALRQQSTC